jgi:hypothetical protein
MTAINSAVRAYPDMDFLQEKSRLDMVWRLS